MTLSFSFFLSLTLLVTGQPQVERLPFPGVSGTLNAITDVPGVTVGHHTLIEGDHVRTGVTAILPRGRTYDPVFAGWHVLNGNGEMTGLHWVQESGFLEGPVMLTNTHSVGPVHAGTLLWMRDEGYYDGGLAALPVIGETWDGLLNDINGFHVNAEHAVLALEAAESGPVAQGNIGGGTGMVCFRFKGGIGTASRRIEISDTQFTVGVLVQANFGRRADLTILGRPIGQLFEDRLLPEPGKPEGGNSIICIIATDAPMLPHQLNRVAQRGALGLARTGGTGKNSSGDFFLAFSTANSGAWKSIEPYTVTTIPNDAIDAVFDATIQATEEAIINAMLHAETMIGRDGNKIHALPAEAIQIP